jgi:transcription elongation factor Elf1
MATATTNGTVNGTVKQGWGTLPCPHCGEQQATILLDLTNLEDLHCQDCDQDYTLEDVRSFIEQWGKVLRWVSIANAVE